MEAAALQGQRERLGPGQLPTRAAALRGDGGQAQAAALQLAAGGLLRGHARRQLRELEGL
jgi:hypothetical protein